MPSIRILLVEDQQPKVAKVADFLKDLGVRKADIEVARSGHEARRLLREKAFDLMVLDVVLPNRADEEPQPDGGVELLREIMNRDTLKRPGYIIGLTAYPTAFQESAGEFADYTWAIVQYEEQGADWHDPVEQLVRHVARIKASAGTEQHQYDADLCVIAALPEEMEALLALDWKWNSLEVVGDATPYQEARIRISGNEIRVLAACCRRMGMISAAVLSANMIRNFRPRIMATVGVCAGVRERVSVGDVVAADPSWDYQSGKITGNEFEIAPHQLPLHSAIRRRIARLADDTFLATVKAGWKGQPPTTALQFHIGPFASGSVVLADKGRMDELRLQHRNLVAIDMEVYGVYVAAAEAPLPTPFPLAMKGVSDCGDETKSDSYRDYAAYVSAQLFHRFVVYEYLSLRPLLRG